MENESPYKMTIGLNVLKHLGINLYSNIAAVITEAVANAWDADAENVSIKISNDNKIIEIEDDGVGMSIEDMNNKYLKVGYERRKEDQATGIKTAKGRVVMGRKGLGKLSLFSIAETIEVHSIKDGKRHGLKMSVEGIEVALKNKHNSGVYTPDKVNEDEIQITKGTKIILKDIKRERLGKGIIALRKLLVRRFSIIGKFYNFNISIGDEQIDPVNREDLTSIQFVWYFGKKPDFFSDEREPKRIKQLPDCLDSWNNKNWSVKGWIGTTELPSQLNDNEIGNLNTIMVLARGRPFQENILEKVNNGRLYTKYLTGQIEVDFLDADDDDNDIATSDRQRVQEDDPRYIELITFLKKQLKVIENDWDEWREEIGQVEVQEEYPAVKEWLDTLRGDHKKNAKNLIAKLSALPIDDNEKKKIMYKHAILAFERMKIYEETASLVENIHDTPKLLEILASTDSLEASLYHDIVVNRLHVIKQFMKITNGDQKEKVIQEYLFDHLWLLDPAWERATGSEEIETQLYKKGVIVNGIEEKEKLSRVDIKYKTVAGKHIIVELKRASRKISQGEMREQGKKYVRKLEKILHNQGVKNPHMEVVFVVGVNIEFEIEEADAIKSLLQSISPGSQLIHYDTLIERAVKAYSEYLEQNRKLDKIEKIISTM